MNTNDKVLLGGGVVAAAVGVYLTTSATVFANGRRPLFNYQRLTDDQIVQRILATPGKYTNCAGMPSGYKEVPIVGRTHTPVVDRPDGTVKVYGVAGGCQTYLDTMRQALSDAGRGDEDVRCVCWLPLQETGWDRAGWNWNLGNRKVHPSGNASLFTGGSAWILASDPFTSVYVLLDGVRSVDFYGSLDSLSGNCTEEKNFFTRNANYAGVLDNYRAGDLAGLLAARTAMLNGGYTGGVNQAELLQAQNDCRFYWRKMTAECGAGFVR